MNTVIIAPFGLLIVVAMIFGLVMLVRALPPGSGPKVALGLAGVLAFVLLAMFFVKTQHSPVVHVPTVISGGSVGIEHLPTPVAADPSFSTMFYSARWLLILIVAAVLVGLFYLIYHLAQSPGGRSVLSVGAIGLVCLGMFLLFGYSALYDQSQSMVSSQYNRPPQRARHIDEVTREKQFQGAIDPVIAINPHEAAKPAANNSTVTEPEPTTFTPETSEAKSNVKPAWLSQGTQTGNGVSQFPLSSELFSSVAECQRDLDSRMSALIAAEARFLVGEEYPITLLPGEAQRLVAETYTEDVITSQGTWYKVHRLIKLNEQTWALFRSRFQQAQRYARLEMLGLGFGGLMLALGVGYLILRRPPRVVDPTLNTFSTT